LRDVNENRITPMGRMPRKSAASMLIMTGKKMRDGDEDHRAERGRRERVKESAAKNAQLAKDPSTEICAYQTKHDVREAAEAATSRNFSRQPPGNQSDDQPIDIPVPVFNHDDSSIEQ